MSFNVLELHWFHKNYELINELNLKDILYKVLGEEKTKILFHTINHPQMLEILNHHNVTAQFENRFEAESKDNLNYYPEFMRIASDNLLNEIRSKLTKEAPFDVILKTCCEVKKFDSLWFLPTIITRPEFINNLYDIIQSSCSGYCEDLYIKHLVRMIKTSKNENHIYMTNIYNEFKKVYLLIHISVASEDYFNFLSRI